MDFLSDTLVPIAICVALPVLLVWLISRPKMNKDNKNAEIILKAIENNSPIDTDRLIEALGRREKSLEETMRQQFLRGCKFTFSGIASLILWIVFLVCFDGAEEALIFLILALFLSAIGAAFLVSYHFNRKSLNTKKKD